MIVKRRVTSEFVQLENALVRDRRLSLDEHGMLHYLLSLPDNWEVTQIKCGRFWNIGREKCGRIFRSLRRTGWAQLETLYADDGITLLGKRWIIGDEPGPEQPADVVSAEEIDDDEEATPETPMNATVAPERKSPAALAGDHAAAGTSENSDSRETPTVGKPRQSENKAPQEERKNLKQNDSTNTMGEMRAREDDDGEPPPRLGELLKIWPADNIASPFACERIFDKMTDWQKLQARNGAAPYLADCRKKGQNRICDLRTFLDERRWERFSKGSLGVTYYHVQPRTPQAYRWREYLERAEPQKLRMFDLMMDRNGYTAASEWPPPLPPKASTAPPLGDLSQDDIDAFTEWK